VCVYGKVNVVLVATKQQRNIHLLSASVDRSEHSDAGRW